MKLLKKAKIINWHYFWNQTIDFDTIVFLTGKNGSGKSTLIDALELVLLGDTTGRYFNKAASEKSARTLKSYLRGEIGDNIDGDFNYLRTGKFSSYIALEFHDTIHDTDFTMGIVFDTQVDGSEEHHFFSLDSKIPENDFIVDNIPMEFKALNRYFNENYKEKYKFFDSNTQYRIYLKRKFGGLADKYFSLLKKASSFQPIDDVKKFITEYVCDPQANINLDELKSNIFEYKKLQDEALVIENRINRLEEVKKYYDLYAKERDYFNIYQYIIEKSELEISKEKLTSLKNELTKNIDRIKEIDNELNENKASQMELENNRFKLINERANNDTLKITKDLMDQRKETQKKIDDINSELKIVKDNLFTYTSNFIKASETLINKLNNFNLSFLEDDRVNEINELIEVAKKTLETSKDIKENYLDDIFKLDKNILNTYRSDLKEFKDKIGAIAVNIARITRNLEKQITTLKEENLKIKDGVIEKPYDRTLLIIKEELKARLKEKFKKDIDVEIYADLVDIKDMSWSSAIEGYLYNQKFNLFVLPRYYMEAYKIFRELIREYSYYRTSLVDQEKILERNYQAETGSLATMISTSHEGARAYTNFLIGRLHMSSDEEECRASGNGITKECDLYRNFSFTRLNPKLYQTSYIGKSIDNRFITERANKLNDAIASLGTYKALNDVLSNANTLEIINTNEIANILLTIEKTSSLKGLKDTLSYIDNELNSQDTTLINSLNKRIDDLASDLEDLKESNDALILEKGQLNNNIQSLKTEKIKQEETKILEKERQIANEFDPKFISEKCLEEFEKAKEKNTSYIQIRQEYSSSLARLQYTLSSHKTELITLRRNYVNDFHLSFNINSETNDEFEKELYDFKEVKLPLYKEKIEDSYNKATQQFKDDFISKLRDAIVDAKTQIEDLNSALVASSFGDDLYKFTVTPSKVYIRYYDMLMDDLILESSEKENAFLEKYQDVMEDLFRQIIDTENESKNSELQSNIEKFTDYRNYLDFDLIVYNKKTNTEQRLSNVIRKKSGGETQTPFYISILASFAQLYHANADGELGNTIRLIIFDEAFSKMDPERIVEAVKLLRRFGLQVILSAPPKNIEDIVEYVDETLLVSHDRNTSCVLLYSKER